jgi:hypothetical protein
MIYKGDRVFTTNIPFLQPNAIQITFADFLLFQNARDEYTAPKLVDYPHILASVPTSKSIDQIFWIK